MGFAFIVLVVAIVVVASVLYSAIKVVKEYERGVIFRLGRVQGGPKGPGLFILYPLVDRMVKIDLRTVTMDVPPQDVITRDNVPARVNAVIYFRVTDPNRSVIEVENHVLATSQISQTTLRSVLGQKDLDQLLTNREEINEELQRIIDEQTDPSGGEGQRCRGQGRGDPYPDAAGDGPSGRVGARAAGQDHSGGGRVPGIRAPQAGRRPSGKPDSPPAEAVSDDGGDRREPELHDHPACTHRPLQAFHGFQGRHSRKGCQDGSARRGGGRAPLRGGRRRSLTPGVAG
jgi:hypothetical protein